MLHVNFRTSLLSFTKNTFRTQDIESDSEMTQILEISDKIFEEIISENFPNMGKEIVNQI